MLINGVFDESWMDDVDDADDVGDAGGFFTVSSLLPPWPRRMFPPVLIVPIRLAASVTTPPELSPSPLLLIEAAGEKATKGQAG